MGEDMQRFEDLLLPGSDERPECRCGASMALASKAKAELSPEAELRTYICEACGHEFKLTVWADAAPRVGPQVGL